MPPVAFKRPCITRGSEGSPGSIRGKSYLGLKAPKERSKAAAPWRAPRPARAHRAQLSPVCCLSSEHAPRENTSATAVKSSSGELAFTDSPRRGRGLRSPAGLQIGFQARSCSVYPGKGKTRSLPFPLAAAPPGLSFSVAFAEELADGFYF